MMFLKSGIRCPNAKKKLSPMRNVTTFLLNSSGFINKNKLLALEIRKKPSDAAMQNTTVYIIKNSKVDTLLF